MIEFKITLNGSWDKRKPITVHTVKIKLMVYLVLTIHIYDEPTPHARDVLDYIYVSDLRAAILSSLLEGLLKKSHHHTISQICISLTFSSV